MHARRTASGKIYLAAKGGLLLQGIILPASLHSFEALPDILADLSRELEKSITAEAEAGEDEDQMEIDPETGEVT